MKDEVAFLAIDRKIGAKLLLNSCMRILFTTAIFPPDLGGPATYVDALSRSLVEQGHRVTVVAFSDHPGGEESNGGKRRVVRVGRGGVRGSRHLRMFRTVVREARSHDIVYANDLHEITAAALLCGRRRLAMKVVGDNVWQIARLGGLEDSLDEFQGGHYGWRIEMRRRLHRWSVRRADRVVVPSEYLAGIVRGWGISEDRVRVVPNAVPAAFQAFPNPRESARAEHGCTGKTLLFVGRLTNWKGVEHLLRALVLLPSDVQLRIAGEGPAGRFLRDLTLELDLQDRVLFLGSVNHEALPDLYRAADAFVLPSSYEGLPHVVLEAMSQETPVVATAVGGTVELVRPEETGLLVPYADVRALAAALARVLEESDLAQRIGLGGRRLVEERTWPLLVSRTEQFLQETAF